jgi:hypothetical protein
MSLGATETVTFFLKTLYEILFYIGLCLELLKQLMSTYALEVTSRKFNTTKIDTEIGY